MSLHCCINIWTNSRDFTKLWTRTSKWRATEGWSL